MIGRFASEEEAFAMVRRIRAATGRWPGVILRSDGSADLTSFPEEWADRPHRRATRDEEE